MDYPALAIKLGMKNPRSAANAWGSIRKKIEAVGAGESALGDDKVSSKMFVKKKSDKFKAAGVQKSEQLSGKNGQLRRQSAESPATTAQPLSFKVVKRENESRADENGVMKREFGKLDPDSGFHDVSIDQALGDREVHLMALAAADKAQKDRVWVKSEFFDEC